MLDKTLKALVVAMAASGSAGAEPLAVFVSNTIKVDAEDARAFEAVCVAQFAKTSGTAVVPEAQVDAAVQKDPRPDAVAREVGAAGYVSLQLIRLPEGSSSSRIILNASSATPGAPVSETEVTLGSLAEAPEVCSRLARAVAEHLSLEQTQTKDNVIATEASSRSRTHSDAYGGVKTGIGIPLGQGAYDPVGTLAAQLFLERDHYFYEVGAGILVPGAIAGSSGYGGLTSELGASYYLQNTNSSAFVGAGVEPRLIFSGAILNFAPYAQIGWMSARQSRNRFFVEARVAQNLLPVEDTTPSCPGCAPSSSNGSAIPTELTMHAGLTF